ncbi:phage tail protein [Flammeovirga aprica]|uniref:Phage tail protein n=1 Tax=Flammeovirga aprica JL-4 TaxID=694437 RepID=A0A7X9RWZ3_9BACT|nr:phage tail protein [Flammeovirga aprica]NME70278.1 phage tail protein [Flammeovirga aprica JL-4]
MEKPQVHYDKDKLEKSFVGPEMPILPGFRFKVITIGVDEKGDPNKWNTETINKNNSFASFQSISRISAKMKTEKIALLGSHNKQHHVYSGMEYDDVVFKKGILSSDMNLSTPFLMSVQNLASKDHLVYKLDLIIVAFDQKDKPKYALKLDRCFPTAWEMGEFNAETGELLIESVTYSVASVTELPI